MVHDLCRALAPADRQRLLEAVEAAKRRLSSAEATSVDLPFWDAAQGLTRQQFEELTQPLHARLWPPLERMGREAFVQWANRCFLYLSRL